MKKFLLALVCLTASTSVFADDYSTTTILSNPVGIFDNLIVTGDSVLNAVEIGARADTSGPLKQVQTLTVFGTTNLLSSGGTKIIVGGNLVLKGTDLVDYSFNNVYVYPKRSLFLGGSIGINEVFAREIKTLNTFTESTAGTITIGSGNTFKAGSIAFASGDNYKILPSPRTCGSSSPCGTEISWVKIDGTEGDNYGEWGQLFQSEQGDTCDGGYIDEYKCPESLVHEGSDFCTDIRRSIIPEEYWSTVGGVYVSESRGRRECTYIAENDSCMAASAYTYSGASDPIPTNQCPFSSDELNAKFSSSGAADYTIGQLCYEMCKNATDNPTGRCNGVTQCHMPNDTISGAAIDATFSGSGTAPDRESGSTTCTRTQWPAGSGLECTNNWDEKSVRIVTCGAGSGRIYTSGTYYQSRSVKCGKVAEGTSPLSPGTFITVDFQR